MRSLTAITGLCLGTSVGTGQPGVSFAASIVNLIIER